MKTTKIKNNVRKGLEVFNNIDLKEVLDVAKVIVGFLPPPVSTAIYLIINVLEYLIKVQSKVRKLTR